MLFRINRCIVDTTAFELRRDDEIVAVQPQVFDLLLLLLENRHRLVTKEEIFQRIWKNRIVSDAALSSRIKTLRQALGDDGTEQGCIRTVRRRGFRLVAPVEALGAAGAASPPAPQAAAPVPAAQEFVGREEELGLLGTLLTKACAGRRQVVFVTGEAGIGKTCLVSDLPVVVHRIVPGIDRPCAVHRALRHQRALPADLRGHAAPGRRDRRRQARDLPEVLRADVAGADAMAQRRRTAAGRCRGGHPATHAARAGPGPRSDVGRQADRPVAGGPALERSLDARRHLLPGAPLGEPRA